MSKRRKKKPAAPVIVADFAAWMDGYCDAFEDFSDGAWQAAFEGAVEEYNKAHGTRIDPNDGFIMWLDYRN